MWKFACCNWLSNFTMAEGGEDPPKRKRRNLLKLYYGVNESQSSGTIDPTDINSPHFQPSTFMEQLLQKSSLAQLMDKEDEMLQRKKYWVVSFPFLCKIIERS